MANEHRSNPIPHKFACGVPNGECRGSRVQVSAGLKAQGMSQTHDTPQQAFNCHKAYLARNGYMVRDSRTLESPSGAVLVLTKPSRFGARLRGGKGQRWMPSPVRKNQGRRGGTIASY